MDFSKTSATVRRFKDIVAFRPQSGGSPVAFHAKNLEVAEISEDIWASLQEISFRSSNPVDSLIATSSTSEDVFAQIEAWNQETNPAVRSQNLGTKVKNLTLNVTQICNLHCHYCVAGGDGSYGDPIRQISIEKTLPQIRFFMEKLSAGELFHITFLGGEPLLYPEAIRLIALTAQELAEATQARVSFEIITNGTLINQKFIGLMEGILPSIIFSMDGDPAVNDRARPQKNGQGSSALALKGLSLLLENKKSFGPITVHSVFNKSNLAVLAAYNFFAALPVDYLEMTFDVSEKDETANNQFMDEMSQVADLAFAKGGEKELRRLVSFNRIFNSLDEQVRRVDHCGAGKSLLSIDSRSQVFSCPLEVNHREQKVGQDDEIDLQKLEALQRPLIETNNCGNCWARYLCGGGCMYNHKATTGDPHRKHLTYCERTRSLISTAIIYYKKTRYQGVLDDEVVCEEKCE